MQGALLILALGVWWFTNWWVALTVYVVGTLWAYLVNARRLHRQLETAIAIINEHAKELSIRRKQLTVQQNYGLIDDSKWDAEVETFTSRVIEPVTGTLEDLKNRQSVVYAIDRVTRNFVSLSTPFHPGMDPVQYEALVADLLRDLGWETRLTKGSGDQGIDVIAEMRGTKVVIQCKLYSTPVGNSAVQEAIAGMQFDDADYAAVVSNSTFTRSAMQLATTANVSLLHHEQLEALEENIFGTSDWKLRGTASVSATAAVVFSAPEPRLPRVLRDALIIVGGTIAVVVVVAFYNRDPSPLSAPATEGSTVTNAPIKKSESLQFAARESQSQAQPGEAERLKVAPRLADSSAALTVARTSARLPDDLLVVRQSDSAAADHIAEYCSQVTGGNSTNDSLCRTQEANAWQRLVPGNEFPSLSQDIVEKCKLPPFPDSFVGKEACAQYALSVGLK